MKPRVLEVLYSFRVGGSEAVGLDLVHQLAQSGADVMCTAVDGMDGPLRDQCARTGIPIIDLGFPPRTVFARYGLNMPLAKRLRELRLDAIHLQHFLSLTKVGAAARWAGIPRIVVTEHSDAQLRDSLSNRIRVRLTWRLAHRVTVIHAGLREYLTADIGIPSSRIVTVPNGIRVVEWHNRDRNERREELGIGDEFVFMFVGRMDEVKNVPGLIRAFLNVQPRLTTPAKLVIIGGGSEFQKCRELIDEASAAESVLLAGEQHDVRRFLAAADAFVMNSHSEGLPRALLEAMCVGVPAISTAVGGIPDLLEGRGWLTRAGDIESLEMAMLDAIVSPDKRAEFGARARTYVVRNCNHEAVMNLYRLALGV